MSWIEEDEEEARTTSSYIEVFLGELVDSELPNRGHCSCEKRQESAAVGADNIIH